MAYRSERQILVFNPLKRLVAICLSGFAAARMCKVSPQRVQAACNGTQVATAGFYFRELKSDIEVTFEDLGTLDVREYDKLCGVERKVFKTKSMTNKGEKYNSKHKKKKKDGNQNS